MPLTVTAAAAALRAGELSAVDLMRAVQRRSAALDPMLGICLARDDEAALAAAAVADEALAAGDDLGPLLGIPLGVKDNIATAGLPTTAQSRVLDPAFGAQGDAVAIARLRAAGGIIVAKSTTMEFALGAPDDSKGFPSPRNAFDPQRWAGGSSSGTASGVAAGVFLAGLGTDTGGSIRMPAGWNGISGLRPTYGLVPKSGSVPMAWTFDTIGPMARSARDCAILLSALAGYDASDRSSAKAANVDYVAALTGSVEGLRVGVDRRLMAREGSDPTVQQLAEDALAVLQAGGAVVVDVELPWYDLLGIVVVVGMAAESATYHQEDLRSRWADYGAPARLTLATAAQLNGTDYLQAQRVRREGIRQATALFADVDVVVSPTAKLACPPISASSTMTMGGSPSNTRYWAALGFPAMSIPMGSNDSGLPLGLQLAGRPFDEATVLRAADYLQAQTAHHLVESPVVTAALATA
ncbi:MAG: amidase [Actinomycetota bacterium]|nr:MAG: amidase [Actinomycetota bacterium]